MKVAIKFLRAAELEADEAVIWYEEREAGLGQTFRESVEKAIESIQRHPTAFAVVHEKDVRRVLGNIFPYVIIYLVEPTAILVISVFHTSRDPKIWRGRIE
jgi:toxin ParE1/3/4